MKPKVVFILGPTSSGKTSVAVSLAEKINGEVISCDSMQVYRGMNILTQAPSREMMRGIPHYLVRMLSPEEEFSAARFTECAADTMNAVLSRGKLPVFAGGTGLYVKALVDGIFSAPSRDESLRAELESIARNKGNEYLYSMLEEVDPVTASRLHVNDIRRIIRAMEVYRLTGSTIEEKRAGTKGIGESHECRMFALEMARKVLYERIEASVERMFDDGLVDEVKRLRETGMSFTAVKALGVREVSAFLDGAMSLEEAKAELKKNTRRYAKRQLTWFRGDDRIEWINADRPVDKVAEEITKRLKD